LFDVAGTSLKLNLILSILVLCMLQTRYCVWHVLKHGLICLVWSGLVSFGWSHFIGLVWSGLVWSLWIFHWSSLYFSVFHYFFFIINVINHNVTYWCCLYYNSYSDDLHHFFFWYSIYDLILHI